ncbi:hypothetical protein D3C75_1031940 [compost metagenome]
MRTPAMAMARPPIRKYQEPPRPASLTPPAARRRPSRAMITPRPTRMMFVAPEARGVSFMPGISAGGMRAV